MNNYRDTLDYLFSNLPMYHRVGAAAYKANLDNINALSDVLGRPEKKFKSIHVAGTNGKGSVSHMLASVLQEAGYKTGLFTSPHLKDFRERIRINGEMISEEYVTGFVSKYKETFSKVSPSFFEWTTALAFAYFAASEVDVAIIEAGLGGRLDSTNIITPELSVITNISYDHMNLLGDTLEKIAFEKAGIIKERIPVVIGEREDESTPVFIDKARVMQSPVYFAEDNFTATWRRDNKKKQLEIFQKGKQSLILSPGLQGNYQSKNIITVLQSAYLVREKFSRLRDAEIKAGIENVVANTGLKGRWQILGTDPKIIADVGHNVAGIIAVLEQLQEEDYRQLHVVMGMVNDKDVSRILALLPANAVYYFCKAAIPRALDEKVLQAEGKKYSLKGDSFPMVVQAFSAAKKSAAADDLILVTGSIFTVAEIL